MSGLSRSTAQRGAGIGQSQNIDIMRCGGGYHSPLKFGNHFGYGVVRLKSCLYVTSHRSPMIYDSPAVVIRVGR